MGVFHVFKIVQMVPNRATHHIHQKVFFTFPMNLEDVAFFYSDENEPVLMYC